jgi:hypothetical protein
MGVPRFHFDWPEDERDGAIPTGDFGIFARGCLILRSGLLAASRRMGHSAKRWFETALTRLLTMRALGGLPHLEASS